MIHPEFELWPSITCGENGMYRIYYHPTYREDDPSSEIVFLEFVVIDIECNEACIFEYVTSWDSDRKLYPNHPCWTFPPKSAVAVFKAIEELENVFFSGGFD